MCGIAGEMYFEEVGPVGADLTEMVWGLRHRGLDSAGVACFRDLPTAGVCLVVRNRPVAGQTASALLQALAEELHLVSPTIEHWGPDLLVELQPGEPAQELIDNLRENGLVVLGAGRNMIMTKGLGTTQDLLSYYDLKALRGRVGIGHSRMATESSVDPDKAHPFWPVGFEDIAIVHNGQLTNYYKLRRRFERFGYRFVTDNDSELIAVYVAHFRQESGTLQEPLQRALVELDGTFTFIAATPDEIGFAKDCLAAKPLVVVEQEHRVLLASEEVAMRPLLKDSYCSWEPQPLTWRHWATCASTVPAAV